MTEEIHYRRSRGLYKSNLTLRHRLSKTWRVIFQFSTFIGIFALLLLMVNILDRSFGYVAVESPFDLGDQTSQGIPLEELPKEELLAILEKNISRGVYRRLDREKPFAERSQQEVYEVLVAEIGAPTIVKTWTLSESIFNREEIQAQVSQEFPDAQLRFTSWVDREFITSQQSSQVEQAGIRTAILGSLWTIAITILVAFPIGIGAAIYLEEYAGDHPVNRLIQTNINNLAGVPSIIYGMLGLAIFVRTLAPITSGAALGVSGGEAMNGRTILSAGLTLALLVLPLLIINGQEAIRAVPGSLRQASYGLGATKWQTVWYHVLPNAIPGILTGTILAISRAFGETAPLVVVGAATYITMDPSGPFSRFTTLPIQIYQWTARPQEEYRHLAAATIVVLLGLLLTLNAAAIYLRNRYSRVL
jgi:phosphate transport system permease protein